MAIKYYILKGKEVVPVADVLDWSAWFEKADRTVKKTKISDDVNVSTVFMGLDHSLNGDPPLIFETMIFGGEDDGWQSRCSTWEQAETGHILAVAMAKGRFG